MEDMEAQARRFNDPGHRADLLREDIRRKYAAAREATAKAVREREEATRGEAEEEVLAPPPVPDAWILPDGSRHYLTDEEKETERKRIEKFMAERRR